MYIIFQASISQPLSYRGTPLNNFSYPEEPPAFGMTTKQRGSWKRTEITPVLPTAGQKLFQYFEVIWIFSGIAGIFIYFTISRKIPNEVTRNPGQETLF